jgi:Transglycosylase SLT domain
MYVHKGKAYSSFRSFQLIEGMKIFALLFVCLFAVASPLIVTGRLQRGVEAFWFSHVTAHFSTAPDMTGKSGYIAEAEQDARDAGIPPTLFVRQIALESGFDPNAQSDKGAVGIAQWEPDTATRRGVDPYNPTEALRGAAFYMAYLVHTYGGYAQALAAYNAGEGSIQYCERNFGPAWESCEPAATRAYIATIMS